MIFWRIIDNNIYEVKEVEKLGFDSSDALYIPDDYLDSQNFVIMRTCHGIGDWGILSAMPRLLKQKYPNCKVYLPSTKLLQELFIKTQPNWNPWNNIFKNVEVIFNNNPYIDGYIDKLSGEVFHDHYRIYDDNNPNIPLVEQILKFWQFDISEYEDSQPELYFSKEEQQLGDQIIKEYVKNKKEFGCLLISDRFGTQYGKHDEKTYKNDHEKITKLLNNNIMPYFCWTYKPLNELGFDFVDSVLDVRNIDLRIQLYIKSKAKINIGNQCGTNHCVVRYSDVYEVQRQSVLGHNFVKGETYL
tara:strand:- start:397 stop:1299 length:903 start_codon:yes stop_codon:yes gene_type:complete